MATSVFDPSDQESIERKIAVGFERISQILKTLIWNESKTSGLSPIQIQFMVALAFDAKRDWTIGELASRFQLTPATVSDALTALEEKDLVRRMRGKEDKRTVYLSPTSEGKRLAKRLGGWMNVLQEYVAQLGREEKAVLLKSLMQLIYRFQQEGLISTAQICTTCTYFRPNVHKSTTKPHHCAYIDIAFGDAELRIDCPDHAAVNL